MADDQKSPNGLPVVNVAPAATPVPQQKVSGKTSKMDLDRSFNINGRAYEAGKGVEVASEDSDGIKEMTESNDTYLGWASTHHGAVPAPAHPQEATAQTPTRPLAGPEVRQPLEVKVASNEGPMVVVDDKGDVKEVKDLDEAKDVNKEVEAGKLLAEDAAKGSKSN